MTTGHDRNTMDNHVTLPDENGRDNHVTVSQCSTRSIRSDDESLPVLTPRNLQKRRSGGPILRYTTNRNQNSKHSSILKLDCDVVSVTQSELTPIHRHKEWDVRPVFLPRLTDSDQKSLHTNILSDEPEPYIRFPEINVVSKCNARLALNRSITDLLDPELEILNKIKHMPRKKRRRRRQKTNCPIEKETVANSQNENKIE